MDAYRPLFEALMTFEPPVYLFGGFAEDALLHRSVVRPHEDVDVLVSRGALERQLENARSIGFAFDEVRFQPIEGKPVVIGTTDGSVNLEIERPRPERRGRRVLLHGRRTGSAVEDSKSRMASSTIRCRDSTASRCERSRRSRSSRSAKDPDGGRVRASPSEGRARTAGVVGSVLPRRSGRTTQTYADERRAP